MVVKKRLAFFVLGVVLLLMVSGVSAKLFEYKVGVKVIAGTNQNMIVRFEDSSTGDIFKTLKTESDDTGIGRVTLETNKEEVSVIVLFVEDLDKFIEEENIIETKYYPGPYSTDGGIEIDTISIVQEPVVDETEEEVSDEVDSIEVEEVEPETIEEAESEQKSVVTGQATGEGFFTSKGFLWIIGIIVLLVIIFVIIVVVRRRGGTREFKVKKLSDIQKGKENESATSQAVADAQKKIAEAQAEIRSIQNADKVKTMESKLKKDQEALERMKRGEE